MISPGSTYVALGSSFAAGPGIKPVLHKAAKRSGRNYAHLVAEALELNLVDVTYSGATTAHIRSERQDGEPPQIDAVGTDTKLVTVTAGGNDLDYIGTFIRGSMANTLALPVRPLSRRLANRIRARVSYLQDPERYEQVTKSLTEVVLRIRDRAPDSRVLLVDYLPVVGRSTRPRRDVPLTEEQLPSVALMADGLAKAFADAAAKSGAELVAASTAGKDHAVGSAEPWTTGFSLRPPSLGGSVLYHPNAAGMAAVADLVVRAIEVPKAP